MLTCKLTKRKSVAIQCLESKELLEGLTTLDFDIE